MASASIVYRKPGTQPPIYVAGTFSNPPWEPYEMDYTTDADGEHTFTKRITAEPGSKIQYKFRMGPGDWWVLHDGLPTVTDAAGFKNHEMEVPQPRGPTEMEPARRVDTHRVDTQRVNTQKHESDEPVSPTTTTTTTTANDETNRPAVKEKPEDAAKQDLQSYAIVAAQGTSTPDYANVAAEVADSAALLNEEKPETPVPDELAGKIGFRRMTRTPIADVARTAAEVADAVEELENDKYADVAAEVADSAALFDEEKPETPVPDELAGKIGYRRMSNTPIADVARTAAEVADAVEELENVRYANVAAEVADSAALFNEEKPETPVPDDLAGKIGYRRMSNTPIADVARTAAEVADAVEELENDKYANVAAEVADSAALFNEEKPETPVPDDLAGKIGYRRMSNTPIADVARTAAEVADTARELDSDKREFKFVDEESMQQSAPLFAHEAVGLLDDDAPEDQITTTPLLARQGSWGADDDSDDESGGQPPLFAHEAIWAGESMLHPNSDHHPDNKGWEDEIGPDEDDIDVNDPTLERFPSNREDIIDAVRKLESGLNEDQVSFVDGVPLSPVIAISESVTVSRLPAEESAGDFLLSPVPVSPMVTRPTRGFDVSKSPRGSISSAHSSTASLQAIQEAEEPSVEEEVHTVNTVQLPTPRARSSLRNPITRADSDEDEGVVMKEPTVSREPKLNNGGLLSPGDGVSSSQISPRTVSADTARLPEEAEEADKSAPSAGNASEPSDPGKVQPSPRIVIEESEDVSTPAGEQTPRYNSEQGEFSLRGGEGSTTGADRSSNGSTSRLRKPGTNQAEQTEQANASGSATIPPGNERGWFKAFFRVLFIDWIGGFLSKLCGGNRRHT